MAWDQAVLDTIAEHRTGWADTLTLGLMALGQPVGTYVAATILVLLFAWLYRAWRAVAAVLLASVLASGLAEVAKRAIDRPRPPADLALVPAGGLAMPSSIGALTAAAATPLILLGLRRATPFGRTLAAVLAGGTVLVGVSMVYLGAHWLSDVLVGWLLGAAVGVVTFHLLDRVGRRGGVRHSPGQSVGSR